MALKLKQYPNPKIKLRNYKRSMVYNIISIIINAIKQNITSITSIFSIILTTVVFVRTQSKMKKSEQIKIVHDIQESYSKSFDKFKDSYSNYKDSCSEENFQNASIDYIGLLDILEWYAFLAKKQINCEFDEIFDTYLKDAHIFYNEFNKTIRGKQYKYLKSRWENIKSPKNFIIIDEKLINFKILDY